MARSARAAKTSATDYSPTRALRRRVRTITARLEKAYGPRPWQREDDPVAELVGTILSQNTSNVNSHAAFAELTRRLRTWDAVLAAPVEQVADAIRTGGLADQKARTIRAALKQIREDFGQISLDALEEWPPARSMEYLVAIPGVGPKTAACVLMFAFNQPVLPVDTHIHRLAIRLGLVGPGYTAIQTQGALQGACPAELVYAFHVLLIAHGRRVCRAQRPRCGECVLVDLCPSAFSFEQK